MAPSDMGSQLLNRYLVPGSVLYFIEGSHESGSPPHYFVVLNKAQLGKPYLLVNATSQELTIRRSASCFPITTIVEVTPEEYSEFTEETSYFNCNNVVSKTFQQFETLLNRKRLSFKKPISEVILDKLISGVLISPVIRNEHKKLLK